MGALHEGHLDLVRNALNISPNVCVSIFVNPKQFNNPEDFAKYPVQTPLDLAMLNKLNVSNVFIPIYEAVYPPDFTPIKLDISPLDKLYEGFFRPGHFDGVIQVLFRFFDLLKPSHVFFGQKDLQQCMVAEKLINAFFPEISLHITDTRRETSGLAMSSRNMRLSPQGKEKASGIYSTMLQLKNQGDFSDSTLESLKKNLLANFGIETEYLDLVSLPDMQKSSSVLKKGRYAIVFAGYLEGIRLIDNLIFSI